MNARGGSLKQTHAFAAIAIGALLAASCSVGLDFSGLTGGAPAEGGSDAPVALDASDAPRVVNADAGADAGAATDAPPAGFCASQSPKPLFCDDFDTLALSAVWDEIGMIGGITDRSAVAFTSAPNALRIKTNALAAGANLYAVAKKVFAQFTGKPIHVTWAFDLRVDLLDVAHQADGILAAFVFSTGNDYYEWQVAGVARNGVVILSFAEAGSAPDGGDIFDGRDLSTPLPLGKWKHVAIEIVVTNLAAPAGANSAKVFLDGALEVQKPLIFPVMSAPPRLELGTSYVREPSDPWTFYIDNATIDIKSP